jgi:hypothetical protein
VTSKRVVKVLRRSLPRTGTGNEAARSPGNHRMGTSSCSSRIVYSSRLGRASFFMGGILYFLFLEFLKGLVCFDRGHSSVQHTPIRLGLRRHGETRGIHSKLPVNCHLVRRVFRHHTNSGGYESG